MLEERTSLALKTQYLIVFWKRYVVEEMLLLSETTLRDLFSIISIFTKLQPFSINFPLVWLTEDVVLFGWFS